MIALNQPTYSLYEHIQTKQGKGQFFSERRNLLAVWCASIEKATLSQQIEKPIFAGFQQLSYFLPVKERYVHLASHGNPIYIFGQHDTEMPKIANLRYVHLEPQDRLCQEWFLIVNEDHYARALVARETSAPNTPHRDRTFEGVIFNRSEMIDTIHQSLMTVVQG